MNPAKVFTNGDGMLSQPRTWSSRRGDPVVLGTVELRHRKSISWPTMRGGDVSKRNLKEFTIASNEIQHIVIRNSKLAGPRRSASQWIKWHRKTTPTAHPLRSMRDISKTLVSHTEQIGQECTDDTSIRLPNRSHNNEPSPPRIRRRTSRTNPFSTIPKVAPVFFQFFIVELG